MAASQTSCVLVFVLDMTQGTWASAEALGAAYDEVCAARQMYMLGDATRKACIIGVGGEGAAYLRGGVGMREALWSAGTGLKLSSAVAYGMCFAAKHAPRAGGQVVVIAGAACRKGEHMPLMNTAFAASTTNVTINAVWITQDPTDHLLTQACAAADGVLLAPRSGAAGFLLPILLQAFVASPSVPGALQLPKASTVDTRATCFQTGKLLDLGLVCSACFALTHPDVGATSPTCPTCRTELQPAVV